jgi:hypothetical protein
LGAGVLAAKTIAPRLQLCRRPSSILRLVAAARLVLRRMQLAVIAGMAPKALRPRRIDSGGAGRALAATGVAMHRRSSLGRPIQIATISSSALAVTSAPDQGDDQGPSTNSFSSPAVMRPWRGCNLASATGEA